VTELELATENLVTLLADAGPQVVVAAAHAVDHRNPIAQGHSSRVAAIADSIGRHLGILASDLEDLRTAAFLHDVGHLAMAEGGEAFEAPGHAEAGERVVKAAQFSEEVAAAVRHHHEHWDGSGTPDHLVGDSIPLSSRILGVAESFEAMTAGRGCERLAPSAALEQVSGKVGSEFDGAVVEALSRGIRDGNMDQALPSMALPATASV
jgi:putative nucleotidyltransferase with HDIG domain